MKYYLLILLFAKFGGVYGQSSFLINKTWAYKKIAITHQQDTLIMYHSDSAQNNWYLGKVSLAFKVNNTYQGTDINGSIQVGNWFIPNNNQIIVDRDTNEIVSLSNNRIKLSGVIKYRDSELNITGILLTELYTVTPIASLCNSLQTGNWATPSTWSCGHEPTLTDAVTINPGHTITVSSTTTAQAQRIIYNGGKLQFAPGVTKVLVKGDGL
ncbi:hypothetical protein [Spirosoma sp. KNUC1025]|uniref:hypothetical protein n=1 Tax=Spirosoma sp. KNUC1025 TaxID=2894082 RepID=UPI00386F099A|nr:hypothetical protein LN737_15180 [Spirosoma sp. KNUC1025]